MNVKELEKKLEIAREALDSILKRTGKYECVNDIREIAEISLTRTEK